MTLKRAIVAALIVAAIFLAYRWYDRAGAERRYKAFAEEILHRHYDVAAAMSEGLTAADLQRAGSQERIGAGPAMFQTLFPSRFEIRTREKTADGTVTLTSVQTVFFNPPGVESVTRPAMFAKMNQTVKLRKSGGTWKVVACENTFGSMDSLTSR